MSVDKSADEARYDRETQFHDHSFAENARADAAKFYSVVRRSRQVYEELCFRRGSTVDVLEYGCGPGGVGFRLAKAGATVTGIDISPVAIEQAAQRAADEGLEIEYRVMNAERLEFENDSFDVVCGSGILHHLDLAQACREVARVLRPTGLAVFTEPLGHNPLINWYRNRTPDMRTVDEHPLVRSDLSVFGESFGSVRTHFFDLSSLGLVPFRNTSIFQSALSVAHRLDDLIFRVPGAKWLAWNVVVEFEEPRDP